MTDKLRQLAESDTPQDVAIPSGLKPLLIWAVGRWGAGMVIALFFFYAWDREDTRSAAKEKFLLEAFKDQSAASVQTSQALESNTAALRELTRAADRAHYNGNNYNGNNYNGNNYNGNGNNSKNKNN